MMSEAVTLPRELRDFVDTVQWTFAKTMSEWPHEYIVRDRVDENLFVRLIRHIRANGYEGKFYRKSITYYDDGGLVYWTMGEPLEETIIINRCRKEDSYECRLLKGTLPESKSIAAESGSRGFFSSPHTKRNTGGHPGRCLGFYTNPYKQRQAIFIGGKS